MKRIVDFIKRLITRKELTAEEEREVIAKIIKKIKES